MDEILRNNDKFETIKVIMEILCKELGISKNSQLDVIGKELNKVWESYWKSMNDWRELTKKSPKTLPIVNKPLLVKGHKGLPKSIRKPGEEQV